VSKDAVILVVLNSDSVVIGRSISIFESEVRNLLR
jgi:hypothetical protein